jgi:hypothetical protein
MALRPLPSAPFKFAMHEPHLVFGVLVDAGLDERSDRLRAAVLSSDVQGRPAILRRRYQAERSEASESANTSVLSPVCEHPSLSARYPMINSSLCCIPPRYTRQLLPTCAKLIMAYAALGL